MSFLEIPIDINLNVRDNASEPMSLAGTRAEFLHSKYVILAQGIQGLSQAYMMLQFSQMRQMIAQDIIENAQNRLQSAQERYNDAVVKSGPASQEAISAHRQMEIAQNQLERSTSRANMMMMHQFLEIIPMGISIMTALISITYALGAAEASRGGLAGLAKFAVVAGAAAGMGYMVAQQASQRAKHAGGVIPESGLYMLEAGETVNAARGTNVGDTASTFNVSIHAPAGMNPDRLLMEISDKNEREKRRRIPQSQRTY